MSDDLELAGLLGEAPRTPDPGFRVDVIGRVAARAQRRAAMRRGAATAGAFAMLGLVFPLAGAFGLTWAAIQPLATVAGVLGLAYVLALLTIEGPGAVLARSRTILRVRV